ncbi:MAG: 50S ribosomal protein L15 [Candidatus Tectomicrobia bacterium]|uniref:Large ribosomal subunit protein uL15 n=1 Tax=Tectimicrobiota bacterium TaxID=2528274 RepID=A0A932HZL8_UNCTE|nr:50S ribosomal protein L15 [Candidatus Tectomicrobia bacterium]
MADKNQGEGRVTGLGDLRGKPGATHSRKRVGRGPGSGMGKTSTRGHKGAKARSGNKKKPGYEGGQMPIQRRLPKRGFRNIFAKDFSEVNVGRLDRFEAGSAVDAAALRASGLVRKLAANGVKLLGTGEVSRALHLKVQACSESARKKVEGAGGSVEVIPLKAAQGASA